MSKKMKKPIKKRPTVLIARKRGTASARCPVCQRPSRVQNTARMDDGVLRRRRCVRGHLFRTMEQTC